MLYRGYKLNGAITDRVDRTDGDAFPTPADVSIKEVAAALKVATGHIASFETAVDPYPQATAVIPPTVTPYVQTSHDKIATALATVAADPTLAQATKEALTAIALQVQAS